MIKHTHTIRRLLPKNCLSVSDHSVGLALEGLTVITVTRCFTESYFAHIPKQLLKGFLQKGIPKKFEKAA